MQIANTCSVVTGASKGLGASLARELVSRGGRVLLADIDEGALAALAEELHMPSIVCDVTKRESVATLAEKARAEYGRIDFWFNNAGIWAPYVSVADIDANRAHTLMEVNYFGLMYGSIEALRHMQPAGAGVIVNILSVRSLYGVPQTAMYTASKFAAEGFSQSMREEVRPSGVKVLNAYPYRIKTNLFGDNKHADYDTSMEPADVARIIIDNIAKEKPSEHLEIWSTNDIRTEDSLGCGHSTS